METYTYQTDAGQLKENHLASESAPNPTNNCICDHLSSTCVLHVFCPGTSISVLQASTNSPTAMAATASALQP